MSLSEAETLVAAIFKVPSATAKRMVNSADARYSIELQHGLSGTARAPNPRRSPSAIATTLTPKSAEQNVESLSTAGFVLARSQRRERLPARSAGSQVRSPGRRSSPSL
jgi:hypothetical protein